MAVVLTGDRLVLGVNITVFDVGEANTLEVELPELSDGLLGLLTANDVRLGRGDRIAVGKADCLDCGATKLTLLLRTACLIGGGAVSIVLITV